MAAPPRHLPGVRASCAGEAKDTAAGAREARRAGPPNFWSGAGGRGEQGRGGGSWPSSVFLGPGAGSAG